jgi:hypothetical protein
MDKRVAESANLRVLDKYPRKGWMITKVHWTCGPAFVTSLHRFRSNSPDSCFAYNTLWILPLVLLEPLRFSPLELVLVRSTAHACQKRETYRCCA